MQFDTVGDNDRWRILLNAMLRFRLLDLGSSHVSRELILIEVWNLGYL